MRIIAGLAKGMPLITPRTGVRPTADRIRGAIFSSVGNRVVHARVLDLFAGTGGIGLEAASRGATSVTFVENFPDALKCLERNVAEFVRRNRGGDVVPAMVSIERDDVSLVLERLATTQEEFALIFADPPYGDAAQELLRNKHLPQLVADDALLVVESAKRTALSVGETWQLMREATYGDTRASFLRKRSRQL